MEYIAWHSCWSSRHFSSFAGRIPTWSDLFACPCRREVVLHWSCCRPFSPWSFLSLRSFSRNGGRPLALWLSQSLACSFSWRWMFAGRDSGSVLRGSHQRHWRRCWLHSEKRSPRPQAARARNLGLRTLQPSLGTQVEPSDCPKTRNDVPIVELTSV